MSLSFANDTVLSGKNADPVKRIQIHVVEAQGLAGSSGRCPPAYVTIESPGLGMLHQTGAVGKGKKLVWHENTRIVDLKPSAGIKFTVKRNTMWPMSKNVLGSTDTYNLGKLIEMQGKNDKETCVTLSLNPARRERSPSNSSLVVNIRDLDTTEKMQQLKEFAAYNAGLSKKGKLREMDNGNADQSSISALSLDLPRTPLTTSSFSSSLSIASAPAALGSFTPLPATSTPHLSPQSPATSAEALSSHSRPSTASSTCSSLSLSTPISKHASISSSKGKVPPPLDVISEELRQVSAA
ncbi:hypothetical protein AX14_013124 [Amanita brunnescens Koide BX004]|nr:hypothetical protein AX14_013124 [Amanita brunnescens Koide BX004]